MYTKIMYTFLVDTIRQCVYVVSCLAVFVICVGPSVNGTLSMSLVLCRWIYHSATSELVYEVSYADAGLTENPLTAKHFYAYV